MHAHPPVDPGFNSNSIRIRCYQPDDAEALAAIYYNTIHRINIRDYSETQVNVWAPVTSLEAKGWLQKWEKLKPFVAVIDDNVIGFAEFETSGHIDCFYCHHDWINKGVGSALLKAIETDATTKQIKRIYAEVSITAKPFFLRKGFAVVKEQIVFKKMIGLTNFVMEKVI